MLVNEIATVSVKTGNTTTRKYRCTFGPRKGRVVAKASTCTAPIRHRSGSSLKSSTSSDNEESPKVIKNITYVKKPKNKLKPRPRSVKRKKI